MIENYIQMALKLSLKNHTLIYIFKVILHFSDTYFIQSFSLGKEVA